jgi:hypothetical protein
MGDAAGLDRPAAERVRTDHRAAPMLSLVSLLAVVLPFLLVGVRYNLTGTLLLGGDPALVALNVRDASGLGQFVGPSSGLGWSHPGPSWFYLLAGFGALLGPSGAGLVAATLAVHAGFAALLVAAVGPAPVWRRPLMALVVLGYVLWMPAAVFVEVSHPYALLLPTALAAVLAVRAAAGSMPALAGLAAVASFLVQTHVGTVALIGALAIYAGAGLGWQAFRRRSPGLGGRDLLLVVGGALLALLSWLPPVWQQLRPATAGQGNLSRVAHEVLAVDPAAQAVSWREALAGTGRLLALPVFGWPVPPGGEAAGLPLGAVLAVVGEILVATLLVWFAWRRRALVPAGVGVAVLIATAGAVVGPRNVQRQR